MHPTRIIGVFLVSVVLLASPAGAGEIIEGVVTAVHGASLQIDAQTYVMTDETVCQDKSGGRVAMDEIHPGTPVEAEIESGGKLGVVTLDLIR